MSNYIHTPIQDIGDPEFQLLVKELCLCIQLDLALFEGQPLTYMLMVIGREKKALTRDHLLLDGILTTKVAKLSPDSVVYRVCWELANVKKTHIESFDEKTVLSLIKECHKVFCPTPPRPKRTARWQRDCQFTTEQIIQRRRNGVL